MFNLNIRPKKLARMKTFNNWHNGLGDVPGFYHLARELGAERIIAYTTGCKHIDFYRIGNPKAKTKFLVKGGHEDEFTYLPAIYLLLANFLKDTDTLNKVLSKIDIWVIECDDPDGFDKRAWTAVNMDGKERHWPPEYFSHFNQTNLPMETNHSVLPITLQNVSVEIP